MEEAIAREISSLMLEFYARLNASLKLVQQRCAQDEFSEYRRAIGLIMGEMTTEVMMPLYKKFPELEPPEFKAR